MDLLADRVLELGPKPAADSPYRNFKLTRDEDGIAWLLFDHADTSANTLSADLLEDVEFDGPVVEVLRQVRERWDGAGEPDGRGGDEILLPARVVAAANAFVAMISPRAWRPGMSIDEAIDRLMAEVGGAFDRRVVAALINRLDNRGGRDVWADERSSAA